MKKIKTVSLILSLIMLLLAAAGCVTADGSNVSAAGGDEEKTSTKPAECVCACSGGAAGDKKTCMCGVTVFVSNVFIVPDSITIYVDYRNGSESGSGLDTSHPEVFASLCPSIPEMEWYFDNVAINYPPVSNAYNGAAAAVVVRYNTMGLKDAGFKNGYYRITVGGKWYGDKIYLDLDDISNSYWIEGWYKKSLSK